MIKRISFYWAQGEDQAPDIVKRCWDAWGRLNPDWTIELHDAQSASQACAALGIAHPPVTFQGLSDIFRVHDLSRNGGLYVDAATIPVLPLAHWLDDCIGEGFFGFHDPYRRRSVESWFLYSTPDNVILMKWLEEITAYWDRKRRPQRAAKELDRGRKGALSDVLTGLQLSFKTTRSGKIRVIEPKDRMWSVQAGGGAARNVHPYFWLHYLFDLMLANHTDARAAWARVPKLPSYKDLMVRHWKRHYSGMTSVELRTLVAGSRMQKLALDRMPRKEHLDEMFDGAIKTGPCVATVRN